MDLDPTLLRAFVAVAQTGGFTRAAQRLHLTQSAISHQMRRLEEQIGRPLMHRTTRSVTLTDDGAEFLRHAEQVLASLDTLARRFAPSPMTGVVRFGVPENFLGDRLPQLLCRFARAYPSVRLEVGVGMHLDLRALIAARELDLAVVLSPPKAVRGTVLKRAQLAWVAADTFDAPSGCRSRFSRRRASTATSAWPRSTAPASRGTSCSRRRACRASARPCSRGWRSRC